MEYTKNQLVAILDQLVESWNVKVRAAVAEMGYGLETFLTDENSNIRALVARHGYGLDVLVNDSSADVRAEVAKHGLGLDRLVHDWHSGVRIEVANQGYGLDILVDDDVWSVREAVARQGYGLDKLMYDKVCCVREAVARQGYGLDVLLNDPEGQVRLAGVMYLRDQERKERGISSGFFWDGLLTSDKERSGLEVPPEGNVQVGDWSKDQLTGILDKLVNHRDSNVRCALARLGYGLETLMDDYEPNVRAEVAGHGYGLERLVDDEDWEVREKAREMLEDMKGKTVDALLSDAFVRAGNASGDEKNKNLEIEKE